MQKRLGLFAVVALVLIAIIAWQWFRPGFRQEDSGYIEKLNSTPRETVTNIRISRGTESVELVKDGEIWKVSGHQADPLKITSMLDGLYSVESSVISEAADKHATYDVIGDAATVITLNNTLTIHLGKQGALGTYVRVSDDDTVYAVPSVSSGSYTPSTGNWADKRILGVDRAKATKLSVNLNGKVSSAVKKDDAWVRESDSAPVDQAKFDAMMLTLGSFMASSLAPTDAAQNYPSVPEVSLTVEEDGTTKTIEMYRGTDDYLVNRLADGESFLASESQVQTVVDFAASL